MPICSHIYIIAVVVWNRSDQRNLKKLEKINERSLRFVFNDNDCNYMTDRHLYLVIKLRVVPSGAKSNLLSTGALSTKLHYLHGKIFYKRYNNVNIIKLITIAIICNYLILWEFEIK